MGHIKEPEGVDLVINSRPLTREEEIALSAYIRAYNAKHSKKSTITKRAKKTLTKPLLRKRGATSSEKQHERITKKIKAIKKRRAS